MTDEVEELSYIYRIFGIVVDNQFGVVVDNQVIVVVNKK